VELLEAADELIIRFAIEETGVLPVRVAAAYVEKADALADLNRIDDAVAAYDAILQMPNIRSSHELERFLVQSRVNKSVVLESHGRSEESLLVSVGVIDQYSPPIEPGLFEYIAHAMLYRGIAYEGLNKPREAIRAYEALLALVEGGQKGATDDVLAYTRSRLQALAAEHN
jgi:tetratricopeptide (TPR) repeat protein